jgi:hypothetical protein
MSRRVENNMMILIQWFNGAHKTIFFDTVPIVLFIYLESASWIAQLCLSILNFQLGVNRNRSSSCSSHYTLLFLFS